MKDVCDGRTCRAKLVWAVSAKGKRQPFDATPTVTGTYLLVREQDGKPPVARHQNEEARARMRAEAEARGEPLPLLYTPHHATCPDRQQFRKRDRKAAA